MTLLKALQRSLCLFTVIVTCAAAFNSSALAADEPAKTPSAKDAKPAEAPAAKDEKSPTGKRTSEQVQTELRTTGESLRDLLGNSPDVLTDPAKRKEIAPKAIPVMKRMAAGLDELAGLEPDKKNEILGARLEFLTILGVFGDPDATAEMARLAMGKNQLALDAACSQQLVAYWKDTKDEAAQIKVLDEMKKIAQANPDKDIVAHTLMKMASMGAASKAVSERAENIVSQDLKGELAQAISKQVAGQRKMKESLNKPVELSGTQLDGTAFSSKNWKGKVILVDFWATWCGPCIKELPRVKKAYLDHHAKGLEILGVSCDEDVAALKGFLDKNKDMPWPQLFDAKENPKLQWHPLAREWGIQAIPTMFLIDRKGTLRSVDARADFEEAIPKMLEEKAE